MVISHFILGRSRAQTTTLAPLRTPDATSMLYNVIDRLDELEITNKTGPSQTPPPPTPQVLINNLHLIIIYFYLVEF